MNKQELIQKAREAILRGKDRVEGYSIYTAKIDLDAKLDEIERDVWEISRKLIIEGFGYTVVDISTNETDRGLHTIINYLSMSDISDLHKNFIQLLLGDDIIRYKINARRIKKGISFEKANILFSRILHRYPHEEDSRIKIALEREIGEIK